MGYKRRNHLCAAAGALLILAAGVALFLNTGGIYMLILYRLLRP